MAAFATTSTITAGATRGPYTKYPDMGLCGAVPSMLGFWVAAAIPAAEPLATSDDLWTAHGTG